MSSAKNVVIRRAEPGDAPALAVLMCELGYETTPEQMERRLKPILTSPEYMTLVAMIENTICGMIGAVCYPSYEHDDTSGRIVSLVVSSGARRHGIGRSLVSAAEKQFAQRGVTRIAVNTQLTRLEAHKFYEALGYDRNGYRFLKKIA